MVIALVRLWSLSGIFTTFGLLVGLKVAALVTLGAFGWWHRRRSIPQLAAGARGVFARVAWIEALILAATFGLAVGLSRTPTPDGEEITGYKASPLAPLLDGMPEPLFFALGLGAAGCYLAGVRRVRGAGGEWPAGRTATWILGWTVVIFAVALGVSGFFFRLTRGATDEAGSTLPGSTLPGSTRLLMAALAGFSMLVVTVPASSRA